ncbi:MAG: efflux RND transporter permease subunit [Chloroflexota bacterium]
MKFIFDKLTRLSLRFRAVTIVLVIALLVMGVISFTRLNQELLPPIDLPQTIILAQAQGMTSEQVLTIITQPIEEQLSQVDEIINLESQTTGSFGAVITAFNDFGIDQSSLRQNIRTAVDNIWLPQRRINADNPDSYLSELDAQVLIYLAEDDSNFLFQLSPETWSTFSDETIRQTAAYLSRQTEESATSVNALQRLVDKEIVPQLDTIPDIANIDVVGGETITEDLDGQSRDVIQTSVTPESLLLRLSPEAWTIIAPRIGAPETLSDEVVAFFDDVDVNVPDIEVDTPPALPESWQVVNGAENTPTYFYDASDLIEIGSLTQPVATVLNNFRETGEIAGALGQTNDLTIEDVERMLALEPTMAQYFESDQILALPQDVFQYITDQTEFIESLDGFTRDAIAARKMAESLSREGTPLEERSPVLLPSQWRIPTPQLITFSFSDIPLATFSVSTTDEFDPDAVLSGSNTEAVIPTATPLPMDDTNTTEADADALDQPAAPAEDAPLPMIFGQEFSGVSLAGFLGVELKNTSDLLTLNLPDEIAAVLGSETLSAAEFFNLLVNPPEISPDAIPDELAGFNPAMLSMAAPLLIGQLEAANVAYLIENDPEFVSTLDPGVVEALSPDARALIESAADQSTAGVENSDEEGAEAEGPALNREWQTLAAGFAEQQGFDLELETADDLLNLPLPFGVIVQQLASTPELAAFLPNLFGNLPVDAVQYLIQEDPALLNNLPSDVLLYLSDDVLSLLSDETQARAPRPLPNAWTPLLEETLDTGEASRPVYSTADLLALTETGDASDVLNRINSTTLSDRLNSYTVRLMDSLTPQIINRFIREEPDFFTKLDSGVVLNFSSDILSMLTEAEIQALPNLTDEEISQALAIREDPSLSAFAELESLYATDVPAADPSAPALNSEWTFLEPQYGIELDSADDFFRFPEGYPFADAATLINSVFDSPQGANFAPQLLGNMPVSALEYIVDRDATVLEDLIPPALALLPEEGLALLSEDLQERAEAGIAEFTPQNQITRTDGNDSLFVTVFKTAEANTVSTFAEVEELLQTIDAANESITVGVVFEQSSFVEQSIEGVAREGSLGAVFAVVIILIFLSGGVWGLRGRRLVGMIMIVLFTLLLLLLTASNLQTAGNDWGQAFAQSDTVLRVLLIVFITAGLFIVFWPGNVPDPAWRATLVIAVSIPLSIMTALFGMYVVAPTMHDVISPLAENSALFEFILRLFPEELTLNIMTLSGLTVAVGRVVDDSIVVLENIFRQLQAGGDKREAIIQGTRDVSAAIFTATLIAVVVFLPLGFTGGLIGAFFLPFGLAVTYALAGSFLVALTVIPVLAFLFIDPDDLPEDSDIWLASYYRPVLRWALKNGWTKTAIIVAAVASMLFAGFLFSQRPFAFLPNFGEPQITVNVNMPPGTSIIETNTLMLEMEQWIEENIPQEQITATQVNVGGGGANFETLLTGGGVSENQASLVIGLDVSQDELEAIADQIEREAIYIFNACPQTEMRPNQTSRDVMTTAEVDGTTEIVCADGTERTNNVEVAAASIADAGFGGFALVVSGPITSEINQDIIDAINSIDGLSKAESNFAAQANGDSQPTFIRVNRAEAFSYSAEVNTENTIGVTQQAVTEIQSIPAIEGNICEENATDTSNCFTVSQGFESEIQTEGFTSLGFAMILAIGIVIVVLAATMQSFVYWLSIIFSIFVAPVGAAIALTLADRVLGISALIGLLMLIGLVIANAVVLIDRVRSNRRERGMVLQDALIEAGGRRLRPILMTSLATIIALTPLAIGLSEGAIIASELGTVVIGGSISSTLLTLIVVPVVYSVLSPLHRLLSFRKDGETRTDSSDKAVNPASAD